MTAQGDDRWGDPRGDFDGEGTESPPSLILDVCTRAVFHLSLIHI